jgi:hypothetical protein
MISREKRSGSSALIECLNSHFRLIQLDAQPPQTKSNFIRSFPGFFFLSFGRNIWTNDHMVKDCGRVTFPVMLDMTSCALQTENRYSDQLAAVISHPAIPRRIKVIT